jgi:uncharacterized protein (TIGR02594 family)
MKTTLDIQSELQRRGYYQGDLDGIRGRQTIAALKQFQRAQEISIDGVAGTQTLGKLFPKEAPVTADNSPDATPWLDLAYRKKGLHEKINNAELRAFLNSDGKTLGDPAKLPWCGDFVETCLAVTMPDEILPLNPYGAMNWAAFGKATKPKKGAILSFWRGSPTSWQGHVGFYIGEDATHFHVLGGNQSDAVTISRIEKKRLRVNGARWPFTALATADVAVVGDGDHLVETTNEA